MNEKVYMFDKNFASREPFSGQVAVLKCPRVSTSRVITIIFINMDRSGHVVFRNYIVFAILCIFDGFTWKRKLDWAKFDVYRMELEIFHAACVHENIF